MVRKISWSIMTLFALGIAGYATMILFVPAVRNPLVAEIFANVRMTGVSHVAGGLIALAIGAFQLNARLRARYLGSHRWLGRVYVLAVLVGGVAGLMLAFNSFGGMVTHFGFGMMAVLWLGTTLNAYRLIRAGDIAAHRVWMLRSYALTLAAVTLRIYLPLSDIAGIDFKSAYQAISWLCWVPNLLIIEWFVIARRPRERTRDRTGV